MLLLNKTDERKKVHKLDKRAPHAGEILCTNVEPWFLQKQYSLAPALSGIYISEAYANM